MDTRKKSAVTATTTVCEIARLPVDLISVSIAHSGPRDACRAAVVSPAFRTAADSDVVWNCFLPSNLPLLALGEHSPPPASKKALFMRLSNGPVLLADGLTSIWLDKETGAMSYMLSARKLSIVWSDTPPNFRWTPITGSRIFSDAARFLRGRGLEIHGKIDSSMLSKHTAYTAYIVLRVDDKDSCCCIGSWRKTPVTVSLGGSTSTRDVLLDSRDLGNLHSWGMRRADVSSSDVVIDNRDLGHLHSWRTRRGAISRECGALVEFDDPLLPGQGADEWMELELGDFYNGEGEDGEVSISIVDTSSRRSGLVVLGIEIIAKGKEACDELNRQQREESDFILFQ